MADNPFAPVFMNPNASRTGLFDLRMMASANRMEAPFERRMGGGGGRSPMLAGIGGVPDSADYSSFTYDPNMRAQAMAAGVHPLEANQVRNNAVLPNTGFFGDHPRLSSAIEGGLFGAAYTRPSQTIGEGISNVAGGLLEGTQARQALWKRQFAGPFQASDVLENLQDKQALRQSRADEGQLRHTQMEYDLAKMQEMKNAPPPRYELPANRDVASFRVWHPEDRSYHNEVNPNYDPKSTVTKPNWGGTEHLREYLEPMGVSDPDKATPQQWQTAREQEQADKRKMMAASVQKPPQEMGYDPKTDSYVAIRPGTKGGVVPLRALESANKTAEQNKEKWINSHADNPSQAFRLFANDPNIDKYMSDPKALRQALTKFYDENVGQGGVNYVYDPKQGMIPTAPPASGSSTPFAPPEGTPGTAGSMLRSIR